MFGMFKNKKEKTKFLVVGLGNPGSKYEYTRHNAGFMVLDYIAKILKIKINVSKFKSLFSAAKIGKEDVILLKPQTFMNNSGDAVGPLMTFYKIPLENIIVIHDDMDLKLGNVREKIGGSSAGHNGIKSIDSAIGNEYRRVRIGIGHPRDFESPINPADWVLGKFDSEQLKQIKSVIESIKI